MVYRYEIDMLGLPTRTRNALVRAGLTTPDDLLALDDDQILAMPGLGAKSLSHIRRGLADWRAAQPAAQPLPATAAEDGGEDGEEEEAAARESPWRLLPGRVVLHAAWLPEPTHRLFVWAEGQSPSLEASGVDAPPPHPLMLPASSLRELLQSFTMDVEAADAWCVACLPTADGRPFSSPQFIPASDALQPAAAEGYQRWSLVGLSLPPLAALAFLNNLPAPADVAPRVALGSDLAFWSLTAKFALELLAGQHFAPTLVQRREGYVASWVPVIDDTQHLQTVEMLAQAMPAVCRAIEPPVSDTPAAGDGEADGADPLAPRPLLRDCLAGLIDPAIRAWAPPIMQVVTRRDAPILQAWLSALFTPRNGLVRGASPRDLDRLVDDISTWHGHLLAGAEEAFRICFRLEPPAAGASRGDADEWTLRFLLQARDDPSLLIPAEMVWRERGSTLSYLDRRFDHPQERLLAGLAHAARIYPPLRDSLRQARPERCILQSSEAYGFLREAAALLDQSGFGVLVPDWWKKRRRRLGVRIAMSPAEGSDHLSMDALVRFDWQIAVGGQNLSPDEFRRLAALKRPLVEVQGEWVELQPEQIEAALHFWERREHEEEVPLREALRFSFGAVAEVGELPVVDVEHSRQIETLVACLEGDVPLAHLEPPEGLAGTLRPYQALGYSWLHFLHRWGFGACLADDMGLGKTIQAIALILRDVEADRVSQPVLVICPTSVVGNWARELARFAPSLRVLLHHGSDRASGDEFLHQVRDVDVVISTYVLARRDRDTLLEVRWAGVILDEAQNIKNPAAKQTQAIRRLQAGYRVALTGTPVENRLSELWSIMQFLNEGYLGSQKAFRSRYVLPIERYRDREASDRLRRLVRPFILRRVKTDPAIVQDLPEKLENKVYCTLTAEQATLYQAVVDDTMLQIEAAGGMQRRGLILAMLMRLKQICNHPAQFTGDASALLGRSGKLSRLVEMVEEVLAVGERALIFTQFAQMGSLLQAHLQDVLASEVLYLYGGTPAERRGEMIRRFQEDVPGPPIFILSLKAGGLGLNLTRANHVFHFDRWWNPAVENQATDRAFRIGQTKDVWVHKFICVGTLEERIDALIESKRALADTVIDTGEAWLTEMSTSKLRDLVAMSQDALG